MNKSESGPTSMLLRKSMDIEERRELGEVSWKWNRLVVGTILKINKTILIFQFRLLNQLYYE